MLLLSLAPSSGRLALLLGLAWLGADVGRFASRAYPPRPAARRLLYQLGGLYIRLFGFAPNARLSACPHAEFTLRNSEF